jgi:hypothetical protein
MLLQNVLCRKPFLQKKIDKNNNVSFSSFFCFIAFLGVSARRFKKTPEKNITRNRIPAFLRVLFLREGNWKMEKANKKTSIFLLAAGWPCHFLASGPRSTPGLWGRRQSEIDAARGWSSEVTSCGRSGLKVGAK